MKRPEKSAGVIAVIDFVRVLFEPVRSAEPPTISGSAGIRLSSANSHAVRVAISLGEAASFSLISRTALVSAESETSPRMRRSNSARLSPSAARRFFQSARAGLPRLPASRQAERISAGTSNGVCAQCRFSRAPLLSSAPTKAGKSSSHGSPLGADEIKGARENLHWAPTPFEVPADILSAWREAGSRGKPAHADWKKRLAAA